MLTTTRRGATAGLALAASLAVATPAHAAVEPSYGPVPVVVVVCGDCLVDASTAAPLAAVVGGPVVLVERGQLSQENDDLLRALHASEAIIVGGDAAVSPAVFNAVRQTTVEGDATRLGGADRYATSRQVAAFVADFVAGSV